jgi:hypothetical protein
VDSRGPLQNLQRGALARVKSPPQKSKSREGNFSLSLKPGVRPSFTTFKDPAFREVRQHLREAKAGRQLAALSLSALRRETKEVLQSVGPHYVALLTYTAQGGRFMTSGSDTDFVLLRKKEVPDEKLLQIQEKLYVALAQSPWPVSFKSWERVKVNPVDIRCLHFLCGNPEIFVEQVVQNPEVAKVNSEDVLITSLASIDRYLEFVSSVHFSRGLRSYRTSEEIPDPIAYGDVKFFKGGIRCLQAIVAFAELYSEKKFSGEAPLSVLTTKELFSKKTMDAFNAAADFFLTAKDLCLAGNNIFNPRNLSQLQATWGESKDEITSTYDHHTATCWKLLKGLQDAHVARYPLHSGVRARVSKNENELRELVRSKNLEVWKNIALRSDIPRVIRAELRDTIGRLANISPHPLLDEMSLMTEFAETPEHAQATSAGNSLAESRAVWLTDRAVTSLRKILGMNLNDLVAIQKELPGAFLELYSAGHFPDPRQFEEAFLSRVRNFFHCHTVFPEAPTAAAKKACAEARATIVRPLE